MAEKKGQTTESLDTEPTVQTPEPDVVPEPKPKEPPEPDVPKEFKGKTSAELIKMVTDTQKELGGKAKEIGDLRNNLAYSDQLRELAMQRAREGSQPTQQPQEPQVDWNFEKPIESVEQIVDRKLGQRERMRQQYDLQRTQSEAKSNYAEGRNLAMKRNPALYEGIEREAEDAVYEGYQRGHAKLHDLRNPDSWDIVAKMIHLRDNKIDRLQPTAIKPVETVGGELPTPAPPGTTEKPFTGLDYTDRDVQKMMDQYGLTKEDAEEIIRKNRKLLLEERGNNVSIRY